MSVTLDQRPALRGIHVMTNGSKRRSRVRAACCGKKWTNHPGIISTCAELQEARRQLSVHNGFLLILKVKFIPKGRPFTNLELVKALKLASPGMLRRIRQALKERRPRRAA